MDVSTWLRDLGLENYVQAFQANDIEAEVLPRLTADDLTALGITSVGHRRRLLDAIAGLDQRGPTAAAEPIAATTCAVQAERRQLTVLFCDLVGSTALAARLDPEDLRDVTRAYQEACAEVVCRFEGHVARFLGDGVLVYFGWPRAHEDDAERAVRAGLQLVEAVARLEPGAGVRLQARVGVATGHVVVGDLISEGISDKDAVSGDTPNLAARLQVLAAPGRVVISQSTRRLVGGAFQLRDLGPQRLKGFAEPLSAWQVEGQGRAEGRFEARQTTGLTPLVGREEEITLLLRRWRQAQRGEGQVVLLSGEPGIGKSRIVRELRARLEAAPHVHLLCQCSPHHQTSPLHPVIAQLERAAGFERDESPEAKVAKLEALLARGTDRLDQAAPLIAALLGVPTDNRYRPLDLTPQRQRQRTLEALIDQLGGLAAAQPVLVIYEDAHWIDPTTQELLGLTIEHIQCLPVLCVVVFRPEFTPPWSGQAHVSALALTRLCHREGSALVDRVAGNKGLPAEVIEQIVARTDGVPLFVEELTKTVLDSGLLTDAGDHYELSGPLPPLAIPMTLHGSLMARLDRLAPVKEIAQIGAALGREFAYALLAAVAAWPETELQAALDQLVAAELVFRRGVPPEATYSFKHALVQDAAYSTLLKSRRQQLHARIASAIESGFPNIADSEPEIVAQHLEEAGLLSRAVQYWTMAGERATRRSASLEAIAHLSRGLEIIAILPESAERLGQELRLRVALCPLLVVLKGYGAPETAAAFAAAKAVAEQTGDRSFLFPLLYDEFFVTTMRADYRKAQHVGERFLVLAEAENDPGPMMIAQRAMGVICLGRGALSRARASLEISISLYRPDCHVPLTFQYGLVNPRVAALAFLARTLQLCGHPDQARNRLVEATALARELGHTNSLAFALTYGAALLYHAANEPDGVAATLRDLRQLMDVGGPPMWRAYAEVVGGWALAQQGRAMEGLKRVEDGMRNLIASASRYQRSQVLALLAQVQIATGNHAAAIETLDGALDFVAESDERYFEAELLRLRAGCYARGRSTLDTAVADLCRALDVARAQSARLWELRAATSLARLWRDQGKRVDAHELLAPVYGWFTEGFDTADLKAARELLDELS